MQKCPTDITTKCWEGKRSGLWPPSQTYQNKIMPQCSALEVLRGFGSWMPIRIHYLESFKKYRGLNPNECRLARSPGYKPSGRQGRKLCSLDSCSTLITYRTRLELQWLDQGLIHGDPVQVQRMPRLWCEGREAPGEKTDKGWDMGHLRPECESGEIWGAAIVSYEDWVLLLGEGNLCKNNWVLSKPCHSTGLCIQFLPARWCLAHLFHLLLPSLLFTIFFFQENLSSCLCPFASGSSLIKVSLLWITATQSQRDNILKAVDQSF